MTIISRTSRPYQDFGLDEKTAKAYPDFVYFLKANEFEHRFSFFRDVVQLQPNPIGLEGSEPTLLLEGKPLTWTKIRQQLWGQEEPKNYYIPQGWRYVGCGLEPKNSHKWERLSTCWTDPRFETDEQFKGKHYVEVVTNPKGLSNHCHLRLINDKGEVISVGLTFRNYRLGLLRSHKGHLASPDPLNFKGAPEIATTIEVTKEEYDKIIQKIETDQKVQNLFVNLITRNCSEYVREVMQVIGMNIENKEYPSNALFFRRWFHAINVQPAPWVQKTLHYIAMFFRMVLTPVYNLGLIALGVLYTDPSFKKLKKEHGAEWEELSIHHRRPFTHWTDFFNWNSFKFATGWKISEWQNNFAQKRRTSLEKLSDIEEDERFEVQYNRSLSPEPVPSI